MERKSFGSRDNDVLRIVEDYAESHIGDNGIEPNTNIILPICPQMELYPAIQAFTIMREAVDRATAAVENEFHF